MTTRVTLQTNMPFGAISAITGGNQGSMDVALKLYTKWKFNPLKLLTLDDEIFHDERLWGAYKYVCGEDIDSLDEFITAVRSGQITHQQALHAINNRGDGLPDGPAKQTSVQTPHPIQAPLVELKPATPAQNRINVDVLVVSAVTLGVFALFLAWVHN